MKRIENPINPVEGVRRALFELRDTLLRGGQLGPKTRVLRPELNVAHRLAGGLYVVPTLDFYGVAFSHGL
ncbi:hypothetical protein [Hyphomicrobium sp. 99]|uniref:hypothetical protein n=1 Tax=Hyphomicrobium sp. 99 TaxID=1163419 RepID=UPI0005F8265F|nr:hypothetical protein [Hyphomicrobium sp. 99]